MPAWCRYHASGIRSLRRESLFGLILATSLGLIAVQASAEDAATPSPAPWAGALLGDLAGARPALDRYGIEFGLQTTNDALGNPNGGRARGVTNAGETQMSVGADLQKLIGLEGVIFNVSALQNYGHGLSARDIDNLNTVSSIEAIRSTYLYELWYQQSFAGGKVDVKVGQLGADTEFIITQYGGWFVNAAFGWPTLPSVDLPSGGPAAPLATPGVRLRVQPSPPVTLLVAAFNGAPAGPGLGNPQRRDPNGVLFRVGDGVFAIAEAQYAINGSKDAEGPPVTIKFGAWYHDKASPNQFYANDGYTVVPEVAEGSGIAQQDWSGYAVADAMLLPASSGKGGLAGFVRFSVAPPGRSAVSAELAGGLVYVGPFGRDKDQVGLAATSVRVGQPLGGTGSLASEYKFHGYETVVELSYQAQVRPWLQIQPDIQFVVNPGGGIPDPERPGHKVGSAAVLGLRTVATF